MLELVQGLTVAFCCRFHSSAILGPGRPIHRSKNPGPQPKKTILGVASLAIGCLLANVLDIQIFGGLAKVVHQSFQHPYWDTILSGFFISGGTEGFNSFLKFANYKKEESKANAADKKSQLSSEQLRLVNPPS